jgi:hypothetical protein
MHSSHIAEEGSTAEPSRHARRRSAATAAAEWPVVRLRYAEAAEHHAASAQRRPMATYPTLKP